MIPRLPLLVLLVAIAVAAGLLRPAQAVGVEPRIATVDLIPVDGATFEVDGRSYNGVIELRPARDGLVLTELVDLDGYLSGIREVPFSWPRETLAAQVVAARTYLAYTLFGGRRGAGSTYGFDICASSACQVYAGAELVNQEGGIRWLDAVERTAGQILVYGERPAEAVYSSSAGSRTMANQDVWGGSPVPYLQPVDSPEQGVSPWASWHIELAPEAFVFILRQAGYAVGGNLFRLSLDSPPEGAGRATLWVVSEEGTVRLPAVDLKGILNRHGPRLYPGGLPARLENGRRLPQALPSYNFDVSYVTAEALGDLARRLPAEDLPIDEQVVLDGEGWGHGVGMSQWGAKALGDRGLSYDEILGHYYGGLTPVDGDPYLPDEVVVGLDWKLAEVTVTADGPFEIRVNGVRAGYFFGGEWTFHVAREGVRVVPPQPLLEDPTAQITARHWPL